MGIEALEARAREALARDVYDYYAGGADDERTLAWNREAFDRWALVPRVLVDVSRVSGATEVPGARLDTPILVAPMAFQALAHPDGETATARAARETGSLMVASTLSTRTVEEIAGAAAGPFWLQVYVFRDRELTGALVDRARAAGCTALCLTVDVPVQGKRERDARNRFTLPPGIEMANFQGHRQSGMPDSAGSGLHAFIGREFDPTLDWGAVEWLAHRSGLPVIVKGILSGDDARRAAEHGAAGVVVSNHGGRQLDGALATLDALPGVVGGAEGRLPVLLDGGVRRGVDVARALALGARAVLLGRPVLWGLATGGEAGVASVLRELREEFERTLALLGVTEPSQLGPEHVVRR